MFGERNFLEDSSSSFEADNPGTPPPLYQQERSKPTVEKDFDFLEEKQPSEFYTNSAGNEFHKGAPGFQPVKNEHNDKIGFVSLVDEPTPEEYQDRPAVVVRPGSSSAQMRAKMLEAKKKQLMDRQGATVTVTAGGLLANSKMEAAPLDNLIYSNNVFTEKDISGSKALKAFNTGGISYEPGVGRSNIEQIPGPIRSEVTIIKSDDMDEVKLDERHATKNTPSKTLQEMHRKMEDAQKLTYPVPQPRVLEVRNERPKEDVRYRAEEISKVEERPKPAEVPRNQLIGEQPVIREEARYKAEIQAPLPPVPQIQKDERTRLPPETKEEVKEQPKNAPVPRQPNVNVRELIAMEMRDMKKFLTSPLRKGILLQCSIRRDKSGFNRLFPKYYMQTSEGLNFLLAGKKRAGNRTSNYMVTMNQKEFNTKSSSFLGKVRSNFLGTEFLIYDTGLNPKRKGANPTNVRSELGVVFYESNIMGSKGPRKMRVLVPAVNDAGESAIWKPMNKNESMLANYKEPKNNTSNMFVFFNKPPKWNEHVQAFVLNFNGRVDKASVKNFQLIDDRDETKIYLQFGRVGDQMFNLDFQWPISPQLAFSIALSSFDNKFACE